MDFKIEITCNCCRCSFELRPSDFKDRPSAECPNCGQAFPSDVYADLKSGIGILDRIPETTDDCAGIMNSCGFSLRVKAYNLIFGSQTD